MGTIFAVRGADWLSNRLVLVIGAMFVLLGAATPLLAQEPPPDLPPAVQEERGNLERNGFALYVLPGLQAGQTLSVYAEAISGSLDPFAAVIPAGVAPDALRDEFVTRVQAELDAGRDPVQALPAIADEVFLAWNDEGGGNGAAALSFSVPTSGDYQVYIGSTPLLESFGSYRILFGLDAPEVLSGQAAPTGAIIAQRDRSLRQEQRVQLIESQIDADLRDRVFELGPIDAGQTLSVHVATTSENLRPIVTLETFRGRAIASANLSAEEIATSLQFTFPTDGSDTMLRVQAGTASGGAFRMLIGLDAPEVLSGAAEERGLPLVTNPIPVYVGVRIDQITSVDQTAENFGAVVDLRMEWSDPALAFDANDCRCLNRSFAGDDFLDFLDEQGVQQWPAFTMFNQQGRRDSQGALVNVNVNGEVIYVDRFSVTLQAPDFDFRLYPLDTQLFYVRVRQEFPADYYVFRALDGFSGFGTQLGEEEWIFNDFEVFVDELDRRSRFNFAFDANRHLTYYTARIFIPLGLILIVSWIIFFLRDYGRRVEVSSGNLLLLIAFNFTISSDLPRLGYLTLLDSLLISAFITTSLALLVNVYLRRLEIAGKRERAEKIDPFVLWLYPLSYLIAFAIPFLITQSI